MKFLPPVDAPVPFGILLGSNLLQVANTLFWLQKQERRYVELVQDARERTVILKEACLILLETIERDDPRIAKLNDNLEFWAMIRPDLAIEPKPEA